MVVNSVLGVEVQTERLWERAAQRGLARILFCNMLDRERADFNAAVNALREAFGPQVVAVVIPVGSEHELKGVIDLLAMKAHLYHGEKAKEAAIPADLEGAAEEARGKLVEAVAETDDDLLEKFFAEEEITGAELEAAFTKAVASAKIFPVAAGSATRLIGVDRLLDLLALVLAPDAVAGPPAQSDDGSEVQLERDPGKRAVAFVFKTMADQFSGRINVFRVFQGTVKSDANVVVGRDGHKERIGQLSSRTRAKRRSPSTVSVPATSAPCPSSKTWSPATPWPPRARLSPSPIEFPAPLMSFAIQAKTKGDEDKVIQALRRLSEEDPMMDVHRDPQTGETIVAGMSQVHVEVICERLKRRFGVEVNLNPPRVPYRETVKSSAKAQGRHKKQTGGRGQFGDTWIEVQPMPRGEGFRFVDKIVGGVIPRNFIPAWWRRASSRPCTRASSPATRWSMCVSSSTTARITPWTRRRWPSRSPAP